MGMDIEEELAFSAFHSISAFCNAGFSTLYGNLGNELVLHNHNLLYITISFLIILGGIGFPILVNLYETVSYESKRLYHRYVKKNKRTIRKIHLYNLNTRIVLIMTAILLVTGTVAIVIFEWNHAFAGMTVTEKCELRVFPADNKNFLYCRTAKCSGSFSSNRSNMRSTGD